MVPSVLLESDSSLISWAVTSENTEELGSFFDFFFVVVLVADINKPHHERGKRLTYLSFSRKPSLFLPCKSTKKKNLLFNSFEDPDCGCSRRFRC